MTLTASPHNLFMMFPALSGPFHTKMNVQCENLVR